MHPVVENVESAPDRTVRLSWADCLGQIISGGCSPAGLKPRNDQRHAAGEVGRPIHSDSACGFSSSTISFNRESRRWSWILALYFLSCCSILPNAQSNVEGTSSP